MSPVNTAGLEIRNAILEDVSGISRVVEKVYPDMPAWPLEAIRSQIETFPEGQFVALLNGHYIAYSALLRIAGTKALKAHTWAKITGNGFASTDDPLGDYLYGIETCVDPDYQASHVGRGIYTMRKGLCTHLNLKGIIAGGRMSRFAENYQIAKTPEDYITLVKRKEIADPTLSFQLSNDFQIIGILQNYLPDDSQSLGYAAHLLWRNPVI